MNKGAAEQLLRRPFSMRKSALKREIYPAAGRLPRRGMVHWIRGDPGPDFYAGQVKKK